MLARAVNGTSAFFPTLGGGFILVALHRLITTLSFHWKWFGILVKGKAVVLAENGDLVEANMRSMKISRDDLLEEARINAQVNAITQIGLATMERNGQVSVLPLSKPDA